MSSDTMFETMKNMLAYESPWRVPATRVHILSTSLISLRDLFHSFALLVSFGYPGFLSAGMFRSIFKIDLTASQMNSRN